MLFEEVSEQKRAKEVGGVDGLDAFRCEELRWIGDAGIVAEDVDGGVALCFPFGDEGSDAFEGGSVEHGELDAAFGIGDLGEDVLDRVTAFGFGADC